VPANSTPLHSLKVAPLRVLTVSPQVLFLLLFPLLLATLAKAQSSPPPPGELVSIGGHKIHFLCSGSGSPTVVVETGLGDFSTDWSLVQSQVEKFTRICTYDRAGYAWSEPGPMPRTFDQLHLELHEGLRALGERGPFVLVGHSFGGLVVRHYPSAYPKEVVGIVLVDTVHEDQHIPMGPHAGLIREDATGRPIPSPRLQIRADERSTKPAPPSHDPLDEDHRKLSPENQKIDMWASAQPSLEAAENSQKEWSGESMRVWHEVNQKGSLGAIPLVVLTREHGGYTDLDIPAAQLEKERLATQHQLTELSSDSVQVIVPSGHQMHLEVPDVVASAIRRVVTSVRQK
jgi:pimeloyl-ACP methyl ester carboxylesterase